jgi:gluconokinase
MVVIVMGVSGAGKSTVGERLARRLGWRFADADDYHGPHSVEKLRRGIPLDEADRAPWLGALRDQIAGWLARGEPAVLACSALRQRHREALRVSPQVRFVHLHGSPELLRERLAQRRGHFAAPELLASQLALLEEPADALHVGVESPPDEIAAQIARRLQLE